MATLGTTTYTVDNLIVGDDYESDDLYPVASGNTVTRGQVMKLTSGKLSPALTTETAQFVMLADVDASAADTKGAYMVEGSTYEGAMNFNTGTADEFREQLRMYGIITRR